MLRIAICIEQDELQEKYIGYLEQMKADLRLTAEIETFADSTQLLFEWAAKERYADLLFLGTTNIDELQVASELRRRGVDTAIVLLLQDATKAMAAFDVKALRCISTNDMNWEEQCQIIKTAIHKCETQIYQHIVLKNRDEVCKVLLKDIHYFEIIHHEITVYYRKRNEQPGQFSFRGSIGQFANVLCDKGFLYPNRSYLVAKSYVKQLIKGKLILNNDVEISVGRTKIDEIRAEMARPHQEKKGGTL